MQLHDFEKGQSIYWLNRFHERVSGVVLDAQKNNLLIRVLEDGKEKTFRTSPTRVEHRED